MKPVERLRELAEAFKVSAIAEKVLSDKRFPFWSGASQPHQHHYREGGLAEHTLEVVELCLKNNEYFTPQNKQSKPAELFLAALFHDAGKMWDYQPIEFDEKGQPVLKYSQWTGTVHKRHIHHISRSGIVWSEAYRDIVELDRPPKTYLSQAEIKVLHEINSDDILHAILSHHGLREWGSPVSPNTRLAWMLHLCDGISARMDDADLWDQRG